MLQVEKHRDIDASFILHDEFQAESTLKVFLWNPWNVLMRMCRKTKEILYITDRTDQFSTSAKMLDITHESYGFSADLFRDFNGGNYRPRCYV